MLTKIHTFTLAAMISISGYQLCRNEFFKSAVDESCRCYDKGPKLVYTGWREKGIIIYLEKTCGDFSCAYIYLRINPSKLLNDRRPYALYSPGRENIVMLCHEIQNVLDDLPITLDFDSLGLSRMDLCKDCLVDSPEIYIQLLNKGIHHSKWKEIRYEDYHDQYSFRRANKHTQITVYDKTFQMFERGMISEWPEMQKILRIEVALDSKEILNQHRKYVLSAENWTDVLLNIAEFGTDILTATISRLIPYGNYYSMEAAREVIENSGYYQNKKESLINFLKMINRSSEINLQQIKYQTNGKNRLIDLATLGINPVTIRARNHIDFLPSIHTLINDSRTF